MLGLALGCLALSLTTAPASAGPRTVCYTVQRGDTAAVASLRLTGSVRNRHAPWFQIFNPATSAIVPKSQYDHIEPGWQACVVQAVAQVAAPPAAVVPRPNERNETGLLAALNPPDWWWV